MSVFDVFGMCVRNLIKRKLRTFLTMLGVIIGTAALVLIVSLGLATNARFERIRDAFVGDLTAISVWQGGMWIWNEDGTLTAPDHIPDLDDYAVAAFAEIPGVRFATPVMQQNLHFRSGPYAARWVRISGITPEALAEMNLTLAEGRLLEPGELNAAVFGAHAELEFQLLAGDWVDRMSPLWFGGETETWVDVMRDTIMFSYDSRFAPWGGWGQEDIADALRPISSFPLNVVGLLEPTGDMSWNSPDRSVFMDIETLQALIGRQMIAQVEQMREHGHFMGFIPSPRENYDDAIVRVYNPEDTSRVAATIQEMGFGVHYQGAHISRDQEQQQTMQNMLVAVAIVSILVAAISIANTMIMAVYERTREIGVMKVIGGSIRDIRRMFLLEATLIGLLGGAFGVALSLAGSHVLNTAEWEVLRNMGFEGTSPYGDVTSLVPMWLCGMALLFASAIGLIAGYFPARRATKLSALAAIRTD